MISSLGFISKFIQRNYCTLWRSKIKLDSQMIILYQSRHDKGCYKAHEHSLSSHISANRRKSFIESWFAIFNSHWFPVKKPCASGSISVMRSRNGGTWVSTLLKRWTKSAYFAHKPNGSGTCDVQITLYICIMSFLRLLDGKKSIL